MTFAGNEPRRSAPQRRDHLSTRNVRKPLSTLFLFTEKKNEVESGRGMGVLLTRSATELSPAYKHVGASQWRV